LRIDQQCRFAFGSGTCKARKDEYPGILGALGGHIFFGDEIHHVPQRRHQRDARGSIKTGKYVTVVSAVSIADWRPGHLTVFSVDPTRRLTDLSFYLRIFLDFRAALG